jgi:hypothetical protein
MDDEDPAAQESGGESGGDSSRSDERQVWDSWDESTGEVWSDESGSEATGAVEGTGLWEECAEDDEAVLTAADELSSDEEYEIVGEGEVELDTNTVAAAIEDGCEDEGSDDAQQVLELAEDVEDSAEAGGAEAAAGLGASAKAHVLLAAAIVATACIDGGADADGGGLA